MPSACCAYGCSNRKTSDSNLIFYRIPSNNPDRRQKWINAVGRKEWSEKQINNARLCSVHFISGRKSDNSSDPDFVPSQFSHVNISERASKQKKDRFDRMKRRRESADPSHVDEDEELHDEEADTPAEPLMLFDDVQMLQDENASLKQENHELLAKLEKLQNEINSKNMLITQCHNDSINLTRKNLKLKKTNKKLKNELFSYRYVKTNQKMHHFYTGIHIKSFQLIIKYAKFKTFTKKITPEDQLLLVLMKLRLGLKNKDLAYRFKISASLTSQIFRGLIPLLAKFMSDNFFSWPEKEALRKHLPKCFRKKYSRCVAIIDCTEIFIERPLGLNARAQTWSNYKNHNTIKYLVACSPTGAVTFLSGGWGGRVSDKEITVKCGFLDWIETGDQVLADRGFTVLEEVATMGGILEIPSFTKGKSQLSTGEVDHSRQIANVRIHIERVIGRMRKFNILNTSISISQVDLLDNIMVSVAGLVNLSPKIVA